MNKSRYAPIFAVLLLPSWLTAAQVTREPGSWILSNDGFEAKFRFTERSTFEFASLRLQRQNTTWLADPDKPSSPIHFVADGLEVDSRTPMRLILENVERIDRYNGVRLKLEFEELSSNLRIEVALEVYGQHPVLRQSVRVRNLGANTRLIEMADMLPWVIREEGAAPTITRVNQWSVLPPAGNFDVKRTELDATPVVIESGAGQPECAWLATGTNDGHGLFAGWEFDGHARTTVSYSKSNNRLSLASEVLDLHHPLLPGEDFQIPPAFVGAYGGDTDEPGFQTQSFTEVVLAKRTPDEFKFPYVVWDSWGYGREINEAALRRNAEIAAKIGVELFIVDLGWARAIGDWKGDPSKFPSGLRELSDYVHSLGMKFGLHVAPAEAADGTVPAASGWLSTEPFTYFGTKGICLSHKPAQQWVVSEMVRMIDEYGVDWILQDGEHMVKQCTRKDHTHDPLDSNYSNSVNGLNAVLDEVQRLRPNVFWENCANGGSMMTFNMVKYYATSILNDASGALSSRKAVYGATFPFPPRYTDRYMPEQPADAYTTRSYMFGGPWIFMNRLAESTPAQLEFAASEITAYKVIRAHMRGAKVFHITSAPEERRTDALEAYTAGSDAAVTIVTRESSASDTFMLRIRGVDPARTYRVHFQDDRRVLTITGEQLARSGVAVFFDTQRDSEIVYADPEDQSADPATRRP